MSRFFKEIRTKDRIPTYKYLVEGEWQESRNRRLINILSPIDGELLGRIQSVLPKEADIAICGASLAQTAWADTPVLRRISILKKAASLFKEKKEFLAHLLIQEVGKTQEEAKREIDHSLFVIQETIKEFKEERTKEKIGKESCLMRREPLGVVLCLTPFNYPIYTSISKIVPALISGNALILKPSVSGSISVLHLGEIFQKAGLPAGLLNILTGRGEEIGRYLAAHDLIKMISFTGSTKVGEEIAKRAKMTKLILELGGKDPGIVLKDADLEKAAREIAQGAFSFAGQRCMGIKRVIVEKSVKPLLIKKLVEITEKEFKLLGDPQDPETQIGPVISDKQGDYLQGLLKDALKKGAKIVLGGKRLDICPIRQRISKKLLTIPKKFLALCKRKGKGRYWQATILDKVKTNMRIAWEEQFGPILPILEVKDEKEAINLANASEYGLDASIFTKNLKKAKELAEKLEVGQVFINQSPHRMPDQFPFTGTKGSGLGTQGIRYNLKEMTRIKAIRY